MAAAPLSPEQLADAGRLKAVLEAWQERERIAKKPWSQEHIAAELGFKTQSAVSQYANGKIPLNPAALRKFAKFFGVRPASISPSIVAEQRAMSASLEPELASLAAAKAANDTADRRQGERTGIRHTKTQKGRAAAIPSPKRKGA